MCVCMYVCMYVYIYIYRERERERDTYIHLFVMHAQVIEDTRLQVASDPFGATACWPPAYISIIIIIIFAFFFLSFAGVAVPADALAGGKPLKTIESSQLTIARCSGR